MGGGEYQALYSAGGEASRPKAAAFAAHTQRDAKQGAVAAAALEMGLHFDPHFRELGELTQAPLGSCTH